MRNGTAASRPEVKDSLTCVLPKKQWHVEATQRSLELLRLISVVSHICEAIGLSMLVADHRLQADMVMESPKASP